MFGVLATLLAGICIGAWATQVGPQVLLFAFLPLGAAYLWRRVSAPLNGIPERPL